MNRISSTEMHGEVILFDEVFFVSFPRTLLFQGIKKSNLHPHLSTNTYLARKLALGRGF